MTRRMDRATWNAECADWALDGIDYAAQVRKAWSDVKDNTTWYANLIADLPTHWAKAEEIDLALMNSDTTEIVLGPEITLGMVDYVTRHS